MPVVSRLYALAAGLLFATGATSLAAKNAAPPPVPTDEAAERRFAEDLQRQHGLDAKRVLATLATAKYQQSIIDAMTRVRPSAIGKSTNVRR